MGSIINNPFRVFACDHFLQHHKELNVGLYVGISRSDNWPDSHPPLLKDTVNERKEFIDNLIAMKKLEPSEIIPVLFKHQWVSGDNDYVVFDNNDEQSVYSKFYTLNSEGRVYQCITKGSGAVANEPLGHNSGNNITGADGYVWKYFYSLKSGEQDLFKDSLWMPIHFGSTYSTQEQKDHGSINVNIAFGSHYLMIKCKIDDDGIPTNTRYHQFGYISGPIDKDMNPITDKYPDIGEVNKAGLNVIYIENKYTVERVVGKWEKINTVIEF